MRPISINSVSSEVTDSHPSDAPHRVLMIGSDPSINHNLAAHLAETYGWQVETAPDIVGGSQLLIEKVFNAIVLHEDDGDPYVQPRVDTIVALRERSVLPLVVLSQKVDYLHVTDILDAGADAFVSSKSPNHIDEIGFRLRALRRLEKITFPVASIAITDRLRIDFDSYEFSFDGIKIDITAHMYKMIEVLVKDRGRFLSAKAMATRLELNTQDYSRNISVHISHLRQRIGDLCGDVGLGFRVIQTVRGKGYRMPLYDELMRPAFPTDNASNKALQNG